MNNNFDVYFTENDKIEKALKVLTYHQDEKSLSMLLDALRRRSAQHGKFIVPVQPVKAIDDEDEAVGFQVRTITLNSGAIALCAFTSKEEFEKGADSDVIHQSIEELLRFVYSNNQLKGLLINPWGKPMLLDKEMIKQILAANNKKGDNQISFAVGDITMLNVEAIVNAANNSLLGGGGVDGAIHNAAGHRLLEECKSLGGCETGEAKITLGYNLPADFVIHTVGPVFDEARDKECDVLLSKCYYNSLDVAKENNVHMIAFPCISTGVYGFPMRRAIPVVLNTVANWLNDNKEYGMTIILNCHTKEDYDMYQEYLNS